MGHDVPHTVRRLRFDPGGQCYHSGEVEAQLVGNHYVRVDSVKVQRAAYPARHPKGTVDGSIVPSFRSIERDAAVAFVQAPMSH